MAPKIAMIGAGSAVFARRLMIDILSWPEVAGATIALMDIDPARLRLIEALARRLVAQERLPARIEATTDRRAALDGADYVVVMVQVGGLEMFERDVAIPRRYGIDQTVGDTLGPGGVFRGLRTIPVLLDLCRDMAELCPRALLINYSNPMAINCWAISLTSPIATIGLCHSVQGTSEQLARYVGVPHDEVSYWVAGINHLAWFLRFERQGEDLYPALRRAMDDPAIYAQDPVRFEMLRHFDAFVTESSHHLSEYVPWFRRSPTEITRSLPVRWDYLQICLQRRGAHDEQLEREATGATPIEVSRSHEYCSHIIHAIETGTPYRMNANVPNTNLIANLPAGCCVEVPCLVDDTGVQPCHVGDLPPQLAALDRANIAVQELAVRAALTGDRRALYHAVALDPLTGALLRLGQVRALVEEMIAAEIEYLPMFQPRGLVAV
ncbi:MAG: alpha-glucosidase/alpha-galactosidase [Chloroflexi bacterium]|nr:alpha-glucosidase/alpha-galactosidase [Chloroflexota bacterium]